MVTNSEHEFLMNRSLAGIDCGKISSWYRNLFTDAAGNYTFYFVGDIDMETFKPLVENILEDFLPGSNNWDGRMTG